MAAISTRSRQLQQENTPAAARHLEQLRIEAGVLAAAAKEELTTTAEQLEALDAEYEVLEAKKAAKAVALRVCDDELDGKTSPSIIEHADSGSDASDNSDDDDVGSVENGEDGGCDGGGATVVGGGARERTKRLEMSIAVNICFDQLFSADEIRHDPGSGTGDTWIRRDVFGGGGQAAATTMGQQAVDEHDEKESKTQHAQRLLSLKSELMGEGLPPPSVELEGHTKEIPTERITQINPALVKAIQVRVQATCCRCLSNIHIWSFPSLAGYISGSSFGDCRMMWRMCCQSTIYTSSIRTVSGHIT